MLSEESNILSIKVLKTKYSKYANNLEKLFKNNSLDYLQDKLKNPIYFKPKEENTDNNKLNNKDLELEKVFNNINKNNNYGLSNGKTVNCIVSKDIKNKGSILKTNITNNNEDSYKNFILEQREKKQRELKKEGPDVWKYNPNYNLKFPKSPSLKLPILEINKSAINKNLNYLSDKQLLTNDNNNNNISKNREKSSLSNKIYKKTVINDNKITTNIINQNSYLSNSIPNKQSILSSISNAVLSNCLENKLKDSSILKGRRFSKYLEKRSSVVNKSYDVPFLKSQETIKRLNNKGTINFSKMLERKPEIINKFKSPDIGFYKPKYNLVENNNMHCLPFKIQKDLSNPKYIIQKLWRSYKVPIEYSTVKLE